jgi:hypothetical protein
MLVFGLLIVLEWSTPMRTARGNILWDFIGLVLRSLSLSPTCSKMKNMDHEGYLPVEVVESGESLVHPSGWVTSEVSACRRESRMNPYRQSSKASREYLFPMPRHVTLHFIKSQSAQIRSY